jgi:hypothetical protein
MKLCDKFRNGNCMKHLDTNKKQTPWSESASEPYRPSGQVSANFLWTEGVIGRFDGSLRSYSRLSRPQPLLFFQVSPQLYS